MIEVFAPAKVNLTLHVTGQRSDGYHLLDSLVMFADVGDVVTIRNADTHSFEVTGPEAAVAPSGDDNSVLKALRSIAPQRSFAVSLEKNLPVSSGIGGGTADAAAAARGVLALRPVSDKGGPHLGALHLGEIADHGLGLATKTTEVLGADFPVCLESRTARMRGIGDNLSFLNLPPLHAVLVNPRVQIATPSVFGRLDQKANDPMTDPLPELSDVQTLLNWLKDQRNDLEQPAISITNEISGVLNALKADDSCFIARMSGSGATCFGLFENSHMAETAENRLSKSHPDWWVKSCVLGAVPKSTFPKPNVS